MKSPRRRRSSTQRAANHSLRIRLDHESKEWISRAARLRGLSLSAYARAVAVPQARREVLPARGQTLVLTPEEQLAFRTALAEPTRLTETQRRLGSIMRGQE
jgi:uncharacterized protein (DUF1778 family)